MFTTLKYLAVLGSATFILGNRVLSKLASAEKWKILTKKNVKNSLNQPTGHSLEQNRKYLTNWSIIRPNMYLDFRFFLICQTWSSIGLLKILVGNFNKKLKIHCRKFLRLYMVKSFFLGASCFGLSSSRIRNYIPDIIWPFLTKTNCMVVAEAPNVQLIS